MATRQNFSEAQRLSAFQANAAWLQEHRVDGIQIADAYEPLRLAGQIYYCENCMFCHIDQDYYDVDHLVADQKFKVWGKHPEARFAGNMVILCKSRNKGDFGCNQSKSSNLYVPRRRGLAYTYANIDMNFVPLEDRPFPWCDA